MIKIEPIQKYCKSESNREKESRTAAESESQTKRLCRMGRKTGINAKCLLNRKDMGWDIEKILTTPISEKRGGKIDNP